MAYIVLRRSRQTCSYYLVESYRDEQGRTRKRTLCYLGREQDGTDTLAKAIQHWEAIETACRYELKSSKGERSRILRDRIEKAQLRLSMLRDQSEKATCSNAERAGRKRQGQQSWIRTEDAEQWEAIQRLQKNPSEEQARAAKRAFRTLAMRLHPDQGGSHEGFTRLKAAYDRAVEVYRFCCD